MLLHSFKNFQQGFCEIKVKNLFIVWECRDCVPCEDDHSHAACEDYETMVVESTFNGECGDECSVFTCECTDPCVQMPEPNCAIDEVQKSRKETDDCGNECRVYWCREFSILSIF